VDVDDDDMEVKELNKNVNSSTAQLRYQNTYQLSPYSELK